MLDSELPRPHGGGVTYLAEVSTPIARSPLAAEALQPFDVTLDEQPLRLRYAKPGGPDADLAWAEEVLARAPDRARRARGADAQLEPVQHLAAAARGRPLRVAQGRAAVLRPRGRHAPPSPGRRRSAAPGHEGDRVLLDDVPGDDQYDAAEPELLEMVTMLVDLQAAWIGRVDDLLRIGLPDWRGPGLTARIADVVQRRSAELTADDRATLATFVSALPARFAEVAACGMPDTLVHGDYHPGNLRGEPGHLTMLDWGDTGVGQPLLDMPAFLAVAPPASVARIREHWLDAWRAAVPGCDAERAAGLLAPVAAGRMAVIYQTFVDNIEPVERRHHDADVLDWLSRTAALARGG